MREIKFRAFDKIDNEMFYSNTYQNKTSMIFGLSNFLSECSDIEETLMQYTGLKDKNGVEIYEGDIVKTNLYNINGYVYYSSPSFGIKQKNGVCTDYNWSDFNNFEVIGNIYENPDLLSEVNMDTFNLSIPYKEI